LEVFFVFKKGRIMARPVASELGIVHPSLVRKESGILAASANIVVPDRNINGTATVLGPGLEVPGRTPTGIYVVRDALTLPKAPEGELRRGKPFYMISDFGDETAQGEYKKTARRTLTKEGVLFEPITVSDVAERSILHGAWVTQRQMSGEEGAVSVTVIDPGVGSERKAIGIVTKDQNVLIGPNNGVLYPAASEHGIESVFELDPKRVAELSGWEKLSRTFHGRDFFSPAAALAVSGRGLSEFATQIDIEELEALKLVGGELLHIDKPFLNLKVNDTVPQNATFLRLVRPADEERPPINALLPVVDGLAGAESGSLVAYTGSSECLEIAVKEGQAGETLRKFGIDLEVGKPLIYEFGFDQRPQRKAAKRFP
jgi:S-adenosylmethionine hydrolase